MTPNSRQSKKFHSNAKNLAKQYGAEFVEAVMLVSELISDRNETDEIQSPHVTQARKIVYGLGKKADRKWQVAIAVSFFCLGIAFNGIVTEMNTSVPRVNWILGYSVAAFIGVAFFAWAALMD